MVVGDIVVVISVVVVVFVVVVETGGDGGNYDTFVAVFSIFTSPL